MELKTICLADMPELTGEELAALIAEEKAAYQRSLNAITDSDALKHKARQIAARKDSCLQCVYNGNDGFTCLVPHTDAYLEDLDIDPCYEGILRYLADKDNNKSQETTLGS